MGTSTGSSKGAAIVSNKEFMAAALQLQKAVLEAGGVEKLLQSPDLKGVSPEQTDKVRTAAKMMENLTSTTSEIQPRWFVPVIFGVIEAVNLIVNVYDTFIKDDTTVKP